MKDNIKVDNKEKVDNTDYHMTCKCKDWEVAIEMISAAQKMSNLHHGVPYTGAIMVYCSWCGSKLQKVWHNVWNYGG